MIPLRQFFHTVELWQKKFDARLQRLPWVGAYFRWRRRAIRRMWEGPATLRFPGKKRRRLLLEMFFIWTRFAVLRWLTPFGRIYVLCFFFSLELTFHPRLPGFYFTLALFAIMLTDILTGWLMRPRMKNIRILPELVAANQPVEIEYRLQNISSRYCWDLHVDTIPIRGAKQSDPEHLTVKCIPPQQTIQLHRKITFSSRGRHELPLLRVASSLPFGLTMCGTTSVDCQDILVYPDYSPLEHIDFPLGKEKAQDYTLLASLQQQDVFEFHACREYRYGDDRRHIHALSWARLGFPVVKEFNEEYKPHACVMIDPSFPQLKKTHDLRSFLRPFLPGSQAPGAEIADALASILCSACDKLLQDGYQMDLFDLSSPSQNLPTLLGPRDLSEVFKVAASLQLQPEFIPPTHAQLQRIVTIQNLLVITASFSQHHVDILRHLQENFVRIKILWINDDPPPTQLQRVSEETVQLRPRQILAGQVTSC